jgi:hypothetical protein
MDIERRLLRLERQNFLLKVVALPSAILAVMGLTMGAAPSDKNDRGELLKITRLQLVNAKGEEVAIINATGIKYSNKDSHLMADVIVGRSRITANPHPDNKKSYVQIGVDRDGHKSYLDMVNSGHSRFLVLSDEGVSNSNFK